MSALFATPLRPWQRRLVAIAWITYAAYYLTRSNLAVAMPDMAAELSFSKGQVGALGTGFFWFYAIGQLVNGQLGDRVSPRRFVFVGMLVSAGLSFAFGWFSSWGVLFILWSINGFFQATGWGPILRTLANWLTLGQRRKISGVFGSCFVAGNGVTLLLTGWLVASFGWRYAFWVPAALLAVAAMGWVVLVRDTPEDAGHTAVHPPPPQNSHPETWSTVLAGLLNSFRQYWRLGLASLFLGFCLVSLALWIPTYYVEVGNLGIGTAAKLSSLIPAAGLVGTLLIGWLVGRFFVHQESKGLLIVLAILTLFFLLYPLLPIHIVLSSIALMGIGVVVYGASSLILTTMPLILGGRHGASGIAGLIDFSFNVGAGLSGLGIGAVLDRQSWTAVFLLLAASAFLATLFVGLTLKVKQPSGGSEPPGGLFLGDET